jgi:hypothetical protein
LGGEDFELCGKWVGDFPGSYGFSFSGNYWASRTKIVNYFPGGFYGHGHVVGCGLLTKSAANRFLFFTKNGQLWGERFANTNKINRIQ